MTALDCVCGHPQGRHLLALRDCKSCPGCTKFELAASVALDVTALLGEVQDDVSREAELAARLAELEQERDQLAALVDQKQSRLLDMSDLLTAARARIEETERDRDAAQAKLDSALLQMAEKIAAEQAQTAKARVEVDSLTAQLEQAEDYARDLQERGIEPADERLYDTHVRYLCPICGGRYREHHNHPCGRLEPVRVRITFIEE
ncbi:hypothetical protein Ait01nite_089750 [Actinoplanes italicus]|uniref:Uncharacterized protein n=1 Tax=Actinoplanes italicus TaxID=113567 RepID=A0A2T0JIX7_9ACTN|nr:hypothetical protein [Actinoplanes italicus]PRX07392.1 hypothetical protein CLV67_14267 [Actinoplanes italicus]GIE35930.1 hypothetical protein Ait01nite_089750 [Actinoplanes italicus]